jgi:hypothetical protein
MPFLEPLQPDTPIVNADRTISAEFYRYLSATILARLQAAAYTSKTVTLANQAAAIGATALSSGAAGRYRVSWIVRMTQAATTSSSFTLTIANTDGAVNVSQAGAAVTGNTTTTVQSGAFIVRADAGTAVTYAIAYASVGATPMTYTVSLTIEVLP